jgi:hypothetical protein
LPPPARRSAGQCSLDGWSRRIVENPTAPVKDR